MANAIGEMRDRVTLQREVRAADGGGGATVTWQEVAILWAKVRPLGVSDSLRAMALSLGVTQKVTIRYRADLAELATDRYRLIFQGRPLRIDGIRNPDGLRRFLELSCAEGQAMAT